MNAHDGLKMSPPPICTYPERSGAFDVGHAELDSRRNHRRIEHRWFQVKIAQNSFGERVGQVHQPGHLLAVVSFLLLLLPKKSEIKLADLTNGTERTHRIVRLVTRCALFIASIAS
ncbi:hypothetical protein ACLKMY_24320 [Paraburkholderia mimosarum]|uniref:hypothetical protein n=1 Tax=Paraburkholderia mimosarum TaxID=312026 RepID=UPI0039C3878E